MAKNTITLRLTRHQANQLHDLLEGLNYHDVKFHSEFGLSYYKAQSCVTDWYFDNVAEIDRFRDKIVELLEKELN